jgi:hypothetical protein
MYDGCTLRLRNALRSQWVRILATLTMKEIMVRRDERHWHPARSAERLSSEVLLSF